MLQSSSADVYTPAELAVAAGIPLSAVHSALARGDLACVGGTHFIAHDEAVRVGRELRQTLVALAPASDASAGGSPVTGRDASIHPLRRAVLSSSGLHVGIIALALWLSAGPTRSAPVNEPIDTTRLVFLVTPGPGGGGGGGGQRSPVRAPRLERRGPAPAELSVAEIAPAPAPTPLPEPEPLPSKSVVAPVMTAAADVRDADTATAGNGMGEGQGPGIGEGSGGGTGGGPYRPGSGVEPPRLLKEVKADYTDEARRRNVTGDVVLEIVVRRDGSVGEVTVLQGLGAGLDQRAVAAVRQWRFAPAQRMGVPVDVIVEVAVEFNLR